MTWIIDEAKTLHQIVETDFGTGLTPFLDMTGNIITIGNAQILTQEVTACSTIDMMQFFTLEPGQTPNLSLTVDCTEGESNAEPLPYTIQGNELSTQDNDGNSIVLTRQ